MDDNATNVLKLMLEYDPEHRTNAQRLLNHRYFKTFRYFLISNKKNLKQKRTLYKYFRENDLRLKIEAPYIAYNYDFSYKNHGDYKSMYAKPLFLKQTKKANIVKKKCYNY